MSRQFHLGSSFGVMQGRLSRQSELGYQVYPGESWKAEFELARDRRLEHIEWVIDAHTLPWNAILDRVAAIEKKIDETGVQVVSVCADFLMDHPLDVESRNSWQTMEVLLDSMGALEASWVVIPYVDQSSLRTIGAPEGLLAISDQLGRMAQRANVGVCLETDLDPEGFVNLLRHLDPDIYSVNYDSGNSASLGYSLSEEFDAYGDRIGLVHLKDRVHGGASVPLGSGDADIRLLLARLSLMDFNGPVTMQAFRDQEGLGALDKQISWLVTQLEDPPQWI